MPQMGSCRLGSVVALAMLLGGCSSAPPISVSLSPNASQVIDQGMSVAITALVTNDTSSGGLHWSLKGPGSLSASSGLSATYQSPTGVLTSAQQVTVTVTSVSDPAKNASLSVSVNPYLNIPTDQELAGGTVGKPYSETIALFGGTVPFQWSIYNGPIVTGWQVGGSVPDGLKLDPATGTISGTPTAAGTWYFEATVMDAKGAGAIDGFLSIQINPGAPATANAVPFLNQPLAPAAVSPGSPGLTLNVSGTGFVSGATVHFDGAPLKTTFVDGEHLSAILPATSVMAAKTASVIVVNPAPGGGSSNVASFHVGAPETAINFANAPNSPLQVIEPFGVTIADFNQDGKPDLAVANAASGLRVELGNGDGTFALASGSPVRLPSPPYDDLASPYAGGMTVGDFNHNGHSGLAIAEVNNAAAVILLGNGDGRFLPSTAAFARANNWPVMGVEAADFNADGNLDLAVINQGASSVVLGYGSGAFNTAGDLSAPQFPAGDAVGDFNRDGRLDLAVCGRGLTTFPDSGVAVLIGNGDGTFMQANGSPISLGENLSAVVTGDFNGDGKLDLVLTDSAGNDVLILLGNGDGTFQPPITVAVGNQPQAIIAEDFNNDGNLDLAVTNNGDNTVTLLAGNGDATFAEMSGSPYATGNGPSAIQAGDFNGDGKLDLAVANVTDGTVSILLQQ